MQHELPQDVQESVQEEFEKLRKHIASQDESMAKLYELTAMTTTTLAKVLHFLEMPPPPHVPEDLATECFMKPLPLGETSTREQIQEALAAHKTYCSEKDKCIKQIGELVEKMQVHVDARAQENLKTTKRPREE